MIARTQDRFGLWPARLAADSAYSSAENLAWLVHERGIEPHIPVFDKSERRDGTFSRSELPYDQARDLYTCPAGSELRPRQRVYEPSAPLVHGDGMMRYRASKIDCDPCKLRLRCTPNMPACKILRSVHEGARDVARDIALIEEYVTSRRQREKVEMLFAHLKRILKLDRLGSEVQTAPATSSTSQPPPRTSASSQSWSRCPRRPWREAQARPPVRDQALTPSTASDRLLQRIRQIRSGGLVSSARAGPELDARKADICSNTFAALPGQQ